MTRPKRLWVVVLVNVAVGSLSLAVDGFLLAKVLAVAGAGLLLAFVPGILVPGVLITSSIFAFLGSSRYRWVALGTAILFFGIHLIQSLWFYYQPNPALPLAMPSLASSVERNSLAIALNLWAFLSDKTDAFFDAVGPTNRWRGP
jgi:hypothetical protein